MKVLSKEIIVEHEINLYTILQAWDKRLRSWLRHYARSRRAAVSILDEVTGFFNRPNPSRRTLALGSTQPLKETNTTNLPGE
jgi:hypothetical protein